MRGRRVSTTLLALGSILAVAAFLRLYRLDLMEFKGDEAEACRLALHALGYSEPGVGRFFPTAGLRSSVGIPNPPLFVYLVAIPLALARSPLAPAIMVALVNVAAVGLAYLAGRRIFGTFAGVAAAALLAASPWAVVFSRKIWAQDLLAPFTALFALQLHALVVRRRPTAVFTLIVTAALALQLHFSAFVFVPVILLALLVARDAIERKWLAAGLAVAAVLYAPYLALHLGAILHPPAGRGGAPGVESRFVTAARYEFGIVGGGRLAYLLGTGSTLGTVLSIVLGGLGPTGLILAARVRHGPERQLALLLATWYVLPLALLTALPIRSYIHYFIVLLPLPYLGLGYLAERVSRLRTAPAVAAVAAAVACLVVVDDGVFHTVVRDGGAPGDYGIAYRFREDAVEWMVGESAGGPFTLTAGPGPRRDLGLRPYRLLVWIEDTGRRRPTGRATTAYLLLRTSGGPGAGAARSQPHRTFGPLTVVRLGAAATPARRGTRVPARGRR